MSRQLTWLIVNSDYLNISQIENALQMPRGTLQKVVNAERELPEKWAGVIDEWVDNFRNFNVSTGL